jgi:hypothetical protein
MKQYVAMSRAKTFVMVDEASYAYTALKRPQFRPSSMSLDSLAGWSMNTDRETKR